MKVDLVLTHANRSLANIGRDLSAHGYTVEHVPLIEISISTAIPDWLPQTKSLIVCSSSYAIDYVVANSHKFKPHSFVVLSERLAARLRSADLEDISVAPSPNGRALAEHAVKELEPGTPVFVLQGSSSDSQILDLCRDAATQSTAIEVYDNQQCSLSDEQRRVIESSRAIFFASPSAVEVGVGALADFGGSIGVIGQTTESHLQRLGAAPNFVADMGSQETLVDQLKNWLSSLSR